MTYIISAVIFVLAGGALLFQSGSLGLIGLGLALIGVFIFSARPRKKKCDSQTTVTR